MKGKCSVVAEAAKVLGTSILLVALQGVVSSASAQLIPLVDGNSTANINFGADIPEGPVRGMYQWTVDGQNELFQQWFWYRVGLNAEKSIDTIGPVALTLTSPRQITGVYTAPNFQIRIDYVLSGGSPGSGKSDIGETIRIINTTEAPLDFHFFQYSDFDLGGAGGDTVQLGKNLRGLFNEADQSDPFAALTETVVTPGANHGEANTYPNTIAKLDDGSADTLNDNVGPVGPGDSTWAFQWDFNIPAGGSALISKDKFIQPPEVPEPCGLALVAIGLTVFGVRRIRRSN